MGSHATGTALEALCVLNPSQVANLMGPIDALNPRGARFHE